MGMAVEELRDRAPPPEVDHLRPILPLIPFSFAECAEHASADAAYCLIASSAMVSVSSSPT